jgi:integrase
LLEAAHAKRRRAASQVLHADVAGICREWIATRRPGELLWPISAHRGLDRRGGINRRTAKMLEIDCAAAGVAHRTAAGRLDFHALRATYITLFALTGAPPKLTQTVARHRDINLTHNVYARVHDPVTEHWIGRMPVPARPTPVEQGFLFPMESFRK